MRRLVASIALVAVSGVVPGCLLDRAGGLTFADGSPRPIDAGRSDARTLLPDAAANDAAAIDAAAIDAAAIDAAAVDAAAIDADAGPPGDAGAAPDGSAPFDAAPSADAGAPADAAPSADAAIDAGPVAVDGGCDPSAPSVCDGDERLDCEAGAVTRTACPLGCAAGACRTLVPSNVGGAVAMDAGDADHVVASGDTQIFDSDDGEVFIDRFFDEQLRAPGEGAGGSSGIYFERVTPPSGPELGVFVVRSLRIEGTLRGRGERPLVILVTEDVTVAGTVDVSSDDRDGGPGGGDGGGAGGDGEGPGAGTGGDDAGGNDDGGGAGGSHASSGGDGGGMVAGAAGALYGELSLVPLVGGSGGGGGADTGGDGGGGGGAIQISAGGSIVVSGVVDAGGAAGGGGYANLDGDPGAGGGAGSGGAILLEAATVEVRGTLAANGGGGGRGFCDGLCLAVGGANGDAATVPAPGASAQGSGGGGGDGSDAEGSAGGDGGDVRNGGGGGGGAGILRVNTRTGSLSASGTFYPSAAGGFDNVGTVTATP